jgi:hypothetical protein
MYSPAMVVTKAGGKYQTEVRFGVLLTGAVPKAQAVTGVDLCVGAC